MSGMPKCSFGFFHKMVWETKFWANPVHDLSETMGTPGSDRRGERREPGGPFLCRSVTPWLPLPDPRTVPRFPSLSHATFGQGWGHMCQTHPEQMSPPRGAKQREEQSVDSCPSDLGRTNNLWRGRRYGSSLWLTWQMGIPSGSPIDSQTVLSGVP